MDRVVQICTRCSACCRWPGEVRITDEELWAIAPHLGMDGAEVVRRFCRIRDDRQGLTLIERDDGACIFLDDPDGCRIQPVKPHQCRRFPNGWNFPGWREHCAALPLHYRLLALPPRRCRDHCYQTPGGELPRVADKEACPWA